jgi:hypothetical protein
MSILRKRVVKFIAGFMCAAALVGIAGVAYVYSGLFDVAASSPHGVFERWALNTTMRRSVITAASTVGEPPAATLPGSPHWA